MTDTTFAPRPLKVRDDALKVFEGLARMRHTTTDDMLEAYVNSFAPVPGYMSDDVLPGETVCHTSDESRAHLETVIARAKRD
jgi:hypothetical protein